MVFTRRVSPTLWEPEWDSEWWWKDRPASRWRWLRNKGWTRASDLRWRVAVDVAPFRADELDVRVVDRDVVVTGRHPERRDLPSVTSLAGSGPWWVEASEGGTVSRDFLRRYPLPLDVRQEDVVANLTRDGILIISAPRFPHSD